MSKKHLALGMIIPLAAAGALATAPAASAVHNDRGRNSDVSCDLSADRDGRFADLTLEVSSEGMQGRRFDVTIWRNGREIEDTTVRDRDGDFTRHFEARLRDGRNRFTARVENRRTGDSDTCSDVVFRGGRRGDDRNPRR